MVNALFSAIPGIGNVLLVSLLFWLIFSILGVQLFAGKFYKCQDMSGERVPADIVPNKEACLKYPGKYRWVNSNVNFDNVINGFLALFQVVSTLKTFWILAWFTSFSYLFSSVAGRRRVYKFWNSKAMKATFYKKWDVEAADHDESLCDGEHISARFSS